jgi:hypothetical protein
LKVLLEEVPAERARVVEVDDEMSVLNVLLEEAQEAGFLFQARGTASVNVDGSGVMVFIPSDEEYTHGIAIVCYFIIHGQGATKLVYGKRSVSYGES